MDYNPRSLTDITDETKETEQKGKLEVDDLKKLVVEKAEGTRIFEIIKDGLLRETFEILEDEEGGLGMLSDELGDDLNTNLESYDREFNDLSMELSDQLGRMQDGQDKLADVMLGFRQELKEFIVGTCNNLAQEQQKTADAQDDLVSRQTQISDMKDELNKIRGSITPETIGGLLRGMKRDQNG
jgi:hypothetical protein